ncbi:MAG: hypothetical protein BRD41_04685 [Bacteroidetes bacterium QS_1_63_11]|nr:MAG: hypothetical protein BRD41_04685 [Bacteroidetes bacterium QS_1_63_11]
MTARPSDSGHEDDAADAPLPIVGVGASAGGIEALKAFFDGLPPTPNMAFVVLIHLSPDHESNLVPILQRHTGLAVEETTDGAVPEANTVTVLPPRSRLRIADGQLCLDEEAIEPGPPSVIDTFFRSLADDQAEAAIGVLLSGTGTDGTLGLRALKERGAFAMAQSPDDAAYGGMPRSAVETGLVDVVDDADELGSKLPEYWAQATKPAPIPDQEVDSESVLRKIFDRLYAETGHDFSGYKRSTIRRRLRRRMAAQRAPTLSAYLEALQDPQEAQALFREFLISVTSFFRDPDDIEALGESVVPDLFDGKGRDDQVRVWVAGCASGEEAYSLAILLDEYAQSHQPRPDIQIFGTDPNAPSIEHAREGRYPKSIAADVSDDTSSSRLSTTDSTRSTRSSTRLTNPSPDCTPPATRPGACSTTTIPAGPGSRTGRVPVSWPFGVPERRAGPVFPPRRLHRAVSPTGHRATVQQDRSGSPYVGPS